MRGHETDDNITLIVHVSDNVEYSDVLLNSLTNEFCKKIKVKKAQWLLSAKSKINRLKKKNWGNFNWENRKTVIYTGLDFVQCNQR